MLIADEETLKEILMQMEHSQIGIFGYKTEISIDLFSRCFDVKNVTTTDIYLLLITQQDKIKELGYYFETLDYDRNTIIYQLKIGKK